MHWHCVFHLSLPLLPQDAHKILNLLCDTLNVLHNSEGRVMACTPWYPEPTPNISENRLWHVSCAVLHDAGSITR